MQADTGGRSGVGANSALLAVMVGVCLLLVAVRQVAQGVMHLDQLWWLDGIDLALLACLLAAFVATLRAYWEVGRRDAEKIAAGARDLDARRRENAELRQMFETTFESAAVGIAHVDLEGNWLRTNGWLSEMLGYSSEELQALDFQHLTHPEDLDRDLELLRQTLAGERDTYRLEKRYIRKDGEVIWAVLHVALVRGEHGEPSYFVSVISDISRNKRLESDLKANSVDLARVNKNLEAFTYSVSHDLRAPLRAILGFAEVLIEDHGDGLDEEAMRITGIIRKNALRMGGLIDSLLAYSRLGRQVLRSEPTSMRELVDEAFELACAAYPQQRVELQVGGLPGVVGDRRLLSQVWINLATNAIKYSSEREVSRIEVGASKEPGWLHFYVRDNGAGFDPAYAQGLFQMFNRLHPVSRFEGHGVGLASVQSIVSRHGGRVWAEGEVDAGATFHFSLPEARHLSGAREAS